MVSNDVVFNIDVRYVDGSEDRFRRESQMGSNDLYGLAPTRAWHSGEMRS